jgi:Domain of Unknown Function (DUF1206)
VHTDGVGVSGATAPRSARADEVARSPAVGWLGRAGLVARGVVYAVIGILALKLALGDGGKATSQQGALKTVAQQPFGKLLLVALAVGLGGYAIWRLTRAAIGHGREDSDSGFDRIAALASGIAYGALCVTAISILIGAGSGGAGSPKKTTGGVLDWPGGTVIVGIAGGVLIGVGLYQVYKGLAQKFLETSKTHEMSEAVEKSFTVLGVVGHVARGAVFALIGFGVIKAAIDYDPNKAVGLDGALRKVVHASYGPLLLGIVAAGFIMFALYSVADARYRKV